MRELPIGPVFTAAEARSCGWTMSGLKHAQRTGRITRVRRGVYATSGQPAHLVRALATARAHPDLPLSHRAAALLQGLPVLGPAAISTEITVRPRSNGNMPGVHVYRATLREHDLAVVDGILVTSPARTVVDLARHHRTGIAVCAADHALHRQLATDDQLADVLAFCRAWPGAPRARRSLALADGLSESPLESISRLVVRRLGLPRPMLQAQVLDQYARFVGRADFYWDEFGVIGEADGRSKYDDREVLTAEKDRQEALEDLGLVIVRWGWDLATRHPEQLRTKLERGFERGRQRDRSGFPRLWTL